MSGIPLFIWLGLAFVAVVIILFGFVLRALHEDMDWE